jgi:hypothetical protein
LLRRSRIPDLDGTFILSQRSTAMPAHILVNLKAYVALVGSIATALLAVYGPETAVGQVLVVLSIVATAFGTWRVENADA